MRPPYRMMNRRERIYDELLALRSQEGHGAAFEELVGRWQERLWRHAWRLTGDEEAAWDALQEGWIAISRGLRGLGDVTAFPAWAYRIVSNKCRDWIRRERRRRKGDQEYSEVAFRAPAGPDSAEEERCADLGQALGRLSGNDRAILALRYHDGFDVAQVAEILGIPEGTVKSRLHHARNRLRAMMEVVDHE